MTRITRMTPPLPGKSGLIGIKTYNQLKGLLDTSKVVIEQIPLTGKSRMENESIRHLEYLTNSSLSVLEDANKIEDTQFTKKTQLENDKIIINIRKKLNNAEKVSKTCDNSLILAISEIDSELSRYPDMLQIPSYFSLMTDSKRLKQDFINNCKCVPKIILQTLFR